MDSLEQYFVQLGASSFILVSDNACSPLPPPIRRTADETNRILLCRTTAATLLHHDQYQCGARGGRETNSSHQLLYKGRGCLSMDQRRSSVSWSGRYSNSRHEEKDDQELHNTTNRGSYRWDAGAQFFPKSSLSKTKDHEDMIETSPVGNKNPIFTTKQTRHGGGKNDVNLVMPQRSTSQESLLSYLCERWQA